MNQSRSRRDFLTNATGFTAAALLGARAFPAVHGSVDETIQLALIGCGGRGGGAAVDALSVRRGPMRLVAMSDAFPDRLAACHAAFADASVPGVDVPPDRRFVGFDGYRHAMDCLRPGDVAILATPPAFRWVHFQYAIEKGLNVFMEKPLCVDGPTTRRMLALAGRAEQRGLKVAVGLMSRHSRAMEELARRVEDGQIGDIIAQYGYRMQGPVAKFRSPPKPAGVSDLEYQIRRFHSFLWASGGAYNDFFIHLIDHLCWMKGAWPVRAISVGGRHYRRESDGVPWVDQNFDSYGVEYTYKDGTKLHFDGRNMDGAQVVYSSFMLGTKGSAILSANGDCGMPSSLYTGHDFSSANRVWESQVRPDEANPYRNEWNDFVDALRDGKPYNEAKRGIEATLVCNMGRMAAHTGQEISFEQMLDCPHEFAPQVAELTRDSPSPLMPGEDGLYPVPQPGILTDREY